VSRLDTWRDTHLCRFSKLLDYINKQKPSFFCDCCSEFSTYNFALIFEITIVKNNITTMIGRAFVDVNRRRSEGEMIVLSKSRRSFPYLCQELMFSLVNALWTDERNRLEVSIVKSIVLVKHHFRNYKYTEFHEFLLRNCKILEQIHSSAKYISAPKLPTQMEEVSLTHGAASTSSDFL
jgi:hypothetical protein